MRIIDNRSRKHLDQRLLSAKPVENWQAPPKGWVRAIRDALGMSGTQLAKRLNVSPQSLQTIEKSEAAGTIQLKTLRRAAEALDCTLVYALVPNTSLEKMVGRRARLIATQELGRVAHTMRLEAQETGNRNLEDRIEDYIRDNIRPRDLWREP